MVLDHDFRRLRKKSENIIAFMVRYLPDRWQAGLTMNGKSNGCSVGRPFALKYRRVNGTFYEFIKLN